MSKERPYVLTIAGFDPSSGAGLSADIKTFEQLKVYGLAICTGYTVQTEDKFYSVDWRNLEDVKKELEIVLNKYSPVAVKFGIVPDIEWLQSLCFMIKNHAPKTFIAVDPVWKSSTGFQFADFGNKKLNDVLENIDLLTPNKAEIEKISEGQQLNAFISQISKKTNLLIKGGHDEINKGRDLLYTNGFVTEINSEEIIAGSKHGSGCVLSAAIISYIALGNNCIDACKKAKKYIETFLKSNSTLLGYHA